jgi:hypothetical protein
MEKSNQEKSFFETDECIRAGKKLNELGRLSLTAADHWAIGSTPSDLLESNPGKTQAELMTNEEILDELREWQQAIEKYSQEEYRSTNLGRSSLVYLKEDFRTTIPYLRSIGRLPKEFENFDIKSKT